MSDSIPESFDPDAESLPWRLLSLTPPLDTRRRRHERFYGESIVVRGAWPAALLASRPLAELLNNGGASASARNYELWRDSDEALSAAVAWDLTVLNVAESQIEPLAKAIRDAALDRRRLRARALPYFPMSPELREWIEAIDPLARYTYADEPWIKPGTPEWHERFDPLEEAVAAFARPHDDAVRFGEQLLALRKSEVDDARARIGATNLTLEELRASPRAIALFCAALRDHLTDMIEARPCDAVSWLRSRWSPGDRVEVARLRDAYAASDFPGDLTRNGTAPGSLLGVLIADGVVASRKVRGVRLVEVLP